MYRPAGRRQDYLKHSLRKMDVAIACAACSLFSTVMSAGTSGSRWGGGADPSQARNRGSHQGNVSAEERVEIELLEESPGGRRRIVPDRRFSRLCGVQKKTREMLVGKGLEHCPHQGMSEEAPGMNARVDASLKFKVQLTVNGELREFAVDPWRTLLEVLVRISGWPRPRRGAASANAGRARLRWTASLSALSAC
jgi:hypothetical protein